MASHVSLVAAKDRGRLNGFGSLWRKENRRWWGTWAWIRQLLIWTVILDGVFASSALAGQSGEAAQGGILAEFFIFGALFPALGVVVMGQNMIQDERASGTAAWVLSKPVSRTAFLLSKLSAQALVVLMTMVLVPGAIAYLIYRNATGLSPSVPGFLAGLGLVYLVLLYFMMLTLMLGTLFRSRGPVIGIPLVLVFAANAGAVPWVGLLLPWSLVLGMEEPAVAAALAQSQPLPTVAPIISTLLMATLFCIIALVRFQREEF